MGSDVSVTVDMETNKVKVKTLGKFYNLFLLVLQLYIVQYI